MKRLLSFSLFFFFVYNLLNGKDLKVTSSDLEYLKKLNLQSEPCFEQLVHRESNLWLTITNWGTIGSQSGLLFETGTDLPAPSACFPGETEKNYLYQGALWVGGVVEGETLVSVGAGGMFFVNNMYPNASCPDGEIKRVEELGDQEFVAVYTDTFEYDLVPEPYEDRPAKPLNIEIKQHSYSWISPPYDEFVILDYKIKNIGNKYISNAYIGFYMDTDIFHLLTYQGWVDDVTGFIEKSVQLPEITKRINFAWAADNDGDLTDGLISYKSTEGVFGFMLLDSSNPEVKTSYNWWVSNLNDPVNLDFGPWRESNWELWRRNYDIWCEGGKGTPCGDRAKYFLMSNGEHDYAQVFSCVDQTDSGWLSPSTICEDLAHGLDIRFLYSFGPFDILPKDSISFAVAIIMGDSLHTGENPLNPLSPRTYHSKLDFNDLISNALIAQMVYESGYTLPPIGPPQDLKIINSADSTVFLSWSSKVHSDLKGYNIYRSSISGEYPDLPVNPEFIQDTFFLDAGLVEGDTYYYAVSSVDEAGKAGKKSEELMIIGGRPNPPTGLSALVDREKVCLSWNPNSEEDVEGYRIYRKEEGAEYEFVKGIGLSGIDTSYCDRSIENAVFYYYAVSAVDNKGIESYLSDSVHALSMLLDPGILLVDMSSPDGKVHVQDDSVNAFYHRALKGYPSVYAEHDQPNIIYLSLKELSPYQVCIIHSEGRFSPAHSEYGRVSLDSTLVNLRRYLEAGGRLILAGRHIISPADDRYYPLPSPFEQGEFGYDILHIDSILFSPNWFCGLEEFVGTHSSLSPEFSNLEIDTVRVNMSYPEDKCDLQGRLPLVGYFVPRYPEEVIYTFNSAYDTSEFEGKAIGMRHIGDDYMVYFFDFPLYYIKEGQSIPLLHKILTEFGLSPTEVEEDLVTLPQDFSLGQNYPNPFNPSTTIPFTVYGSQIMVHSPIHTTLTIYNILGQRVRVLLDKEMIPGNYEVGWDGKDNSGKEVSSGIYFYQLKAADFKQTLKMVLLR